jgi:hypothetical protein
MAEPEAQNEPGLNFTQTDSEAKSWLPWAAAGMVVLLVLGLVIAFGGRRTAPAVAAGPGLAPPDPYASKLDIGGVQMSEASNFAGGKVTYVDGKILNNGSQTLSGVTVQVAFRNDLKEIAQKETMPLSLIRTREPYVDTQPVSASPLKPGERREFRLIFDSVAPDWNGQYPEIRVVHVDAAQ